MGEPVQLPVVAMVMAMDRNRLIGADSGMPWHIPGEQAHFKTITLGNPIVMGRKTFDSIGRVLPGRTNIVVTRNRHWVAEGVLVASSLKHALILATDDIEQRRSCNEFDTLTKENSEHAIMIIGGAALCQQAMAITDRIYLTYIDHEFAGDTWLKSFDWADWQEMSRQDVSPEQAGGYRVAYLVLEKKQVQSRSG